jgi:membrane-associated phospholipid phosphatase
VNDVIPDDRNKLAYFIGLIFHPGLIGIPTLLLILDDLPLADTVFWTTLMTLILIVPGFLLVQFYKRQGRHSYQRELRGVLYSVGWVSIVVCFVVLNLLNAPRVLIICLAALAVWVPLQLGVNHYFTKVSAHTATAAGCAMGLLLLGELPTIQSQILVFLLVMLIGWARVVTKNHTVLQVVLGTLLGAGVVLAVFPLFL